MTTVRSSSNSPTSPGAGAQPVIGRTARERRHSAAFDDTDNQLGIAAVPTAGRAAPWAPGKPSKKREPRPTTSPHGECKLPAQPRHPPTLNPELITDEPLEAITDRHRVRLGEGADVDGGGDGVGGGADHRHRAAAFVWD